MYSPFTNLAVINQELCCYDMILTIYVSTSEKIFKTEEITKKANKRTG